MLNTSDKEIILYFDAESRDGTQTLAYAKGKGLPINEVDLRDENITGTQLIALARKLNANLKELVNTDHPDYKDNYDGLPSDEEGLIKMIKKHPEILNTPIAVKGDKVKVINTPTDIVHL